MANPVESQGAPAAAQDGLDFSAMPLDPNALPLLDAGAVPGADAMDMMQTNPQLLAPMGLQDPASFLAVQQMMPGTDMAQGFGSESTMRQEEQGISEDEIALYDRQIRLWGVQAQEKIRSANVLLITMKALANEIAKNLVLAGIGSLTLLDGDVVTEADLGAQFLLSEASAAGTPVVGQNRAVAAEPFLRRLNPRVRLHVDTGGVISKGPSYFQGFDVVIATDLDSNSLQIINTATRLYEKKFYAAGSHGMYGYIFSDLIEHDFAIRRDMGNVGTRVGAETRTRRVVHVAEGRDGAKPVESVTKRELYSTWLLSSDTGDLPDDYIKSRRRLRGVTPALSCFRALWEFMQGNGGRLPNRDDRDDLRKFTTLATNKHKMLHLPGETLQPGVLRKFLQNLGSELAPVTAILGGQLAQDVINVLGQTQQPIQNMVIFDGDAMEAFVYPLHPQGDLGRRQVWNGAAAM